MGKMTGVAVESICMLIWLGAACFLRNCRIGDKTRFAVYGVSVGE